jgi:hypothetical protein
VSRVEFAIRAEINFNLFTKEVHADALISIGKGQAVQHHDENENAGKGYSNPDDVGGRLHALVNAEENTQPDDDSGDHNLPLSGRTLTHNSFSVIGSAVVVVDMQDVLVEKSV